MAELSPEQIKKLGDAFRGLESRTDDLAQAQKEAEQIAEKNAKALKEFGNYLGKMAGTVASAEQGSAKYGKVITTTTDAVGDLASNFGILGKIVGFVIKQLGSLAAASLKQNDALVKSYRTLSDFGALDSRGLAGVLDTMNKMGGNSENMQNFQNVLKSVAPELAIFGGNVERGTRKFADVTDTLLRGDFERQLKNLGYSTEDIVKYAGQYVASSTRAGTAMGKTTGQLTAGAMDYMKVFSELTMLTGKSRDEQQKVVDDMNRELAWREHLRQLEASGQKDYADKLRSSVQGIMSVNKDAGKYMMETIANQGAPVTEFGARMSVIYGDLGRTTEQNAASSKDMTEATRKSLVSYKSLTPALKEYLNQFGPISRISKEVAASLGITTDTLDALQLAENMDLNATNKTIDAAVKLNNANMKRLETETEREKAERMTRQAMEKLYYVTGDMATPAVSGLAKMINILGKTIADFVYWMSNKFGKYLNIDPIDFRGAFREFNTMADVVAAINEENKKQIDITKERTEIDKELKGADAKLLQLRQEAAKEKQANYNAGATYEGGGTGVNSAQEELEQYEKKLEDLKRRKESLNRQYSASQEAVSVAKAQGVGISGGAGIDMGGKGSLEGLVLKKGDVQKEGAYINPKLIELARKIQAEIPGFAYFSSFNDQFHQDKNSNHNKGLALDFVLSQSIKGNSEASKQITDKLRALGANKIIDEYNNPSAGATGDHIHAEIAGKTQGLFKGPESGYLLQAHGEEALLNKQGLSNLITKAQIASGFGSDGKGVDQIVEAIAELRDRMEQAVDELKRSVSTQQEILTYSKV